MEDLIVANGLHADSKDGRDLAVRDAIALGAISPVTPEDFVKGYSAYDDVGLSPEMRDQASRSTCVAESYGRYGRVLRKKALGVDEVLSASSLYPFIVLPGGGASLRDGAAQTVVGRLVPKSVLPDEDSAGRPISEAQAADKSRITAPVQKSAAETDIFDAYRMAEGSTDDIFIFAAAIRAGLGIVGGFTGSNPGWTHPIVLPPKDGETKWGHAVYLPEFGVTDVEEPGIPIPKGTRCLFTPNSWGGRYTFTSGRWKGRQAIPEQYFKVSQQTAAGEAKGVYVFNGWTITPKAIMTDELFAQDFVKKNDLRIVRNTQDGSFALVSQNRLMQISAARAGLAAITMIQLGINKTVEVDGAVWNRLAKTSVFTNF